MNRQAYKIETTRMEGKTSLRRLINVDEKPQCGNGVESYYIICEPYDRYDVFPFAGDITLPVKKDQVLINRKGERIIVLEVIRNKVDLMWFNLSYVAKEINRLQIKKTVMGHLTANS